ncbi:solute carrier family 25 member 38 [Suillus bovinus]|uniref:solute carrier family 25 member 38 n=1 Tax=Suillus bovinus TaxID=48563 RepID=UPI001B8647AE|nr:solute carrier family 25 member 38 [Suillus bovinus]KAG2130472.1 solute carrier family 25 member 38 [Suillus bovinus]
MKNAAVGQHLLSGALSGFAGAILLQPLDLLKTRIQQGDSALNARNTTIIWHTTKDILRNEGKRVMDGNVPGVALYFTSLTYLRSIMANSPYFSAQQRYSRDNSKTQGNLIAGATARVGVGLILNPFSILKARFELSGSLLSIARMGPSELMRGFVASSLRDAPYAGLFVVIYESIKRETTHAAGIHSFSAASAGAIATMATHPFDVIKVISSRCLAFQNI